MTSSKSFTADKNSKKKAMYAGSFDPVTEGHLDIIRRVHADYSAFHVVVGNNPEKKYTFSIDERLDMLARVMSEFPNVIVDKHAGLMVDYAYENLIDELVRGVRSNTDMDYEKQMAKINHDQNPKISTRILESSLEHEFKSSSAAKEIQRFGGNLIGFVPLYVKQRIEEKISGQYIMGVTGGIASGKSEFANLLVSVANERKIESHNIELDHLAHYILSDSKEPLFVDTRKKIVIEFGAKVHNSDSSIDRKELGKIVYSNPDNMKKLEEIIYGKDINSGPMAYILRKNIFGKKGLIFLNAALIVEKKFLSHVNNNIILVGCDAKEQYNRLVLRDGFSQDDAMRRINSQYSYEEKKDAILDKQKKDLQGKLYEFDNSEELSLENVDILLSKIIYDFSI